VWECQQKSEKWARAHPAHPEAAPQLSRSPQAGSAAGPTREPTRQLTPESSPVFRTDVARRRVAP